jgi:hypothetical protein
MAISVACSECKKDLTVSDLLLGKAVKCPGCGGVVPIRTPSSAGATGPTRLPPEGVQQGARPPSRSTLPPPVLAPNMSEEEHRYQRRRPRPPDARPPKWPMVLAPLPMLAFLAVCVLMLVDVTGVGTLIFSFVVCVFFSGLSLLLITADTESLVRRIIWPVATMVVAAVVSGAGYGVGLAITNTVETRKEHETAGILPKNGLPNAKIVNNPPQINRQPVDVGNAGGKAGKKAAPVDRGENPSTPKKPLSDLEALDSNDFFVKKQAAERLSKTPPTGDRAAIAKKLERLMAENDPFIANAAIDAIVVWGDNENLPALLLVAENGGPFVRDRAIEALGSFPNEKSLKFLVRSFDGMERRQAAVKGLKKYGPMAEKAVLPYLGHQDPFVRKPAIEIISVIGTELSVPALQMLVNLNDILNKEAARKAILAIKQRANN